MGGGMYGWGMREGAVWTSTMGCVIGLCGARFKSERLSAGQWTGSAMRAESVGAWIRDDTRMTVDGSGGSTWGWAVTVRRAPWLPCVVCVPCCCRGAESPARVSNRYSHCV